MRYSCAKNVAQLSRAKVVSSILQECRKKKEKPGLTRIGY